MLGLHRCPACDTLVEFALDGLPERQRCRVRRHLAECPPCREQVRDYLMVGEGLGLCAEQHEVPGDLCSKVLKRLAERPDEDGGRERDDVVRAAGPRVGAWGRFWGLAGPAFAILSLGLAWALWAPPKAPVGAAAPSADNPVAALARGIVGDPAALRVAMLPGPAPARGGMLTLSPGKAGAYLSSDGLAPCPDGWEYVLWMRAATGPATRLARFARESGGPAELLLPLAAAFAPGGPVDFTLRLEPAAGGPAGGQVWMRGSVRP